MPRYHTMDNQQPNSTSQLNLTGTKIGDYRLLRRLGAGGMADVYLAVQESLKRNVALKVLKGHLAVNKDYVERFKREAQAAAGLVHANIVQIFEVGQSDGYYFIAQEYVRGRNLKQYLGRYGAVPPDMALSVLRQSAMALQKGNEHEVVHRDIKPENIMLTANGEIKIADFGLARVGKQNDNTLTQAGITVGTPLYMSPEQIEGNEVDIRSDIYSLGVTVYHMLVGEPPFDGDSPITIAVKHSSQEPEGIRSHREDLPVELEDVVDRMLRKKKEDRPQTPVQLLKMLQSITVDSSNGFDWSLFEVQPSEREVAAVSTVAVGGTTESLMKPPRKASAFLAVLPWLAIMLFSVGAWWLGNHVATLYSGFKNMQTADVQAEQDVPMQCDVEEQYISAYWSSQEIPADDYSAREALWLAVSKYFPVEEAETEVNKTQLYNLRAMSRLGEIYIESGQVAMAIKVYDELAGQEELSLEFRTTGLAGRAIALDLTPAENFEGGIQEQEREIRLCFNAEVGGVRENKDLLSDFLKRRVLDLLEKFKYSVPLRNPDFASRNHNQWKS